MSIVLFIIIGAVVGLLAMRRLRNESSALTIIVLGMAGALIGGLLLRALVSVAGLAGAAVGALLLIMAWQVYIRR